MAPMVTQQAIADPVIAAKIAHTTMVTRASPPVTLPIAILHTFTRRFAIPPLAIRSPARIKNGIHISAATSHPENRR